MTESPPIPSAQSSGYISIDIPVTLASPGTLRGRAGHRETFIRCLSVSLPQGGTVSLVMGLILFSVLMARTYSLLFRRVAQADGEGTGAVVRAEDYEAVELLKR